MKILSNVFANGESIPEKYTCKAENISPPLQFVDIPQETQSLVLIVEDPDAPTQVFTHWLIYNIPQTVVEAQEGTKPVGSREGKNSSGAVGYTGPCPPEGLHHYFFRLYALDTTLDLPSAEDISAVRAAMEDHVIAEDSLMGTFGM